MTTHQTYSTYTFVSAAATVAASYAVMSEGFNGVALVVLFFAAVFLAFTTVALFFSTLTKNPPRTIRKIIGWLFILYP